MVGRAASILYSLEPTECVMKIFIISKCSPQVAPSLELVNTALPVGSISDITLKFLIKLYRILGQIFIKISMFLKNVFKVYFYIWALNEIQAI